MDEKTACLINIKKCEHQKLLALAHIQAKEIRTLELEAELKQCKAEIEEQEKTCKDMDAQIATHKEQMLKLQS